jgi:DNA replication protein DnaD
MNAILSSWKNKNIFEVKDIPEKQTADSKTKPARKDFKAAQREKDTDVYKRLYAQLKSEEDDNG